MLLSKSDSRTYIIRKEVLEERPSSIEQSAG